VCSRYFYQEASVVVIAQESFSGSDWDIVHPAWEEGMLRVRKGVIQRERMVSWLIASLENLIFIFCLHHSFPVGC